ncbi:MAG: iron transporter, partial [Nostocoides sp.]
AYGVHDLQEARFLPGLTSLAFDISHVIEPGGWLGTLLKGIFNVTPATTWLQAICWLGYVGVVLPLFLRPVPAGPDRAPPARAGEPATTR